MSHSSPSTSSESTGPSRQLYRLGVSRYDRVSSMLIALLILLGTMVLIMLIAWLTNQVWGSEKAVPVVMEEIGDQEDDPWGPGDDIEPPPPMETDLVEEELDEILEAVEDAMATRSAMLERGVSGEGTGKGGGGTGKGRKGVRRKWELRFNEGNTLETYAGQLDFFGIELGVLRPGDKMFYISKLSQPRPVTREGPRETEKRYRFTWTQGSLERADRDLLARANINAGRGIVYKFLPPPLYQQLATMEKDAARGQKVRATLFGIKPDGDGYQFYVMRQSFAY